jgi:cell division protein ZapA
MSEVEIRIGGRAFTVACQPGEEAFLEAAARLLDAEAQALVSSLGRISEAQMLLMAGLMLADKTAALEDRLRTAEAGRAPPPDSPRVGALADEIAGRLGALAARAEALAEALETKAGAA